MEEVLRSIFPDQLDPYASLVSGAALALVIFVIGWIASKWAHRACLKLMRARNVDETLTGFLASIVQWAVIAAAAITALGKVGVETTSLIALLGAAGLAIGLALQGSLSNFAAGVMILLFRPFTVGHRISAAGNTGVVEQVGLFSSTLVTPRNETVIIPNSMLTSNCIVNHAARGTCRGAIAIGVAYGTDLRRASQVIVEALAGTDRVLADPAPSVMFSGFGASSLDFEARPWCHPDDLATVSHNARLAINDALASAGIEIPFNQIVVHDARAS